MGTSYETVLVAAALEQVESVLAARPHEAILFPVGPDRTALIPREGPYNYADTDDIAVPLSGQGGLPVLAIQVCDSDMVALQVFQQGQCVHRYVSDQEMLAEWFQDVDGQFKVRIGDEVHPADAPVPKGPIGDVPEVFAQFGVGEVNLAEVRAALRGKYASPDMPSVQAEVQLWNILSALNLDPRPLTVGFRHIDTCGLTGGVHVGRSA